MWPTCLAPSVPRHRRDGLCRSCACTNGVAARPARPSDGADQSSLLRPVQRNDGPHRCSIDGRSTSQRRACASPLGETGKTIMAATSTSDLYADHAWLLGEEANAACPPDSARHPREPPIAPAWFNTRHTEKARKG